MDATLNVRFPGKLKDLKRRGDAVLAREGISTSEAVRGLYRHLDATQKAPAWLKAPSEDVYERRRAAMRSIAGTVDVPADFDARMIKEERLSRLDF